MENRFEQHSSEEQGWGAYATPPSYGSHTGNGAPSGKTPHPLNEPGPVDKTVSDEAFGEHASVTSGAAAHMRLCSDVRHMLPDLLENDGSVRSELAMAIHAHLAVCRGCSQEYDQMQRVVAHLEALPPVQLDMDFAPLIMRRIQAQADVVHSAPTLVTASSKPSVVVTATVTTPTKTVTAAPQTQAVAAKAQVSTQTVGVTQDRGEAVRRFTLGSMLSGVLAFFVSSSWGRQMLGVNVSTAGIWLERIGEMASRTPVIGWIVGLIVTALAQAGSLLGETFHTFGAMAVFGLAIDIAMCALAYYYVTVRRQRYEKLGVR